MKIAVRSPAFRPQAFGVTESICIRRFRLKAGLQTDFPRRREMNLKREFDLHLTRRQFFGFGAKGVGVAALASLFKLDGFSFVENEASRDPKTGGLVGLPHYAPKVKRVIFLHQSGGPSQIEAFDYKAALEKLHGTELPDSIRRGQRITGMTSGQSAFPCVKSLFKFKQHGQSGTWVSELLPHAAKVVDEIAVIKTMYTDAINH